MPEQSLNNFAKGMFKDLEPGSSPNSTYRHSVNGRIFYKSNKSTSWNNVKGNKISFKITQGFKVMGIGEFPEKLAIISSDGSTTEVGIVDFIESKVEGVYRVIFTDRLDPYGDKLNNHTKVKIIPQPETKGDTDNENKVERIYWTDIKNGPIYSFNIKLEDDLTVSPEVGPYPTNYSVHSMNLQADFDIGHIQFEKTIPGSILSGQYQYTYRLLTNGGYATPWIPITRPITVTDTSAGVDGTKYRLKTLGAASGKGNRLQVFVNDSRYNKLEVAYVYSIDKLAPLEAKIFYSSTLGANIEPTGDGLYANAEIVNHIANSGTPITPSQLFQEVLTIESAKEINTKDNIFFVGNIKEASTPLLSQKVLSEITIRPTHRYMHSDRSGETGGGGTPPFIYDSPVTSKAFKQDHIRHSDFKKIMKTFTIDNDYQNYKGTNISTEFTGFFRGETYRVAVRLFNTKGQQGFAQHILDIEMPVIERNDVPLKETKFKIRRLDANGNEIEEDYILKIGSTKGDSYAVLESSSDPSLSPGSLLTVDDSWQPEYPLTYTGNLDYSTSPGAGFPGINPVNVSTTTPSLKIMGLIADNIDLTDVIDDISGFEIVIAERDKKLLGQGILTSLIHEQSDPSITYPLPTNYSTFDTGGRYVDGFQDESISNDPTHQIKNGSNSYFYDSRFYNFMCPDFEIGGHPELLAADKMKLASSLYGLDSKQQKLTSSLTEYYSKAYHNYPSGFNNGHRYVTRPDGSSTVGTESELDIKSLTFIPRPGDEISGYDNSDATKIFANKNPLDGDMPGPGTGFGFQSYPNIEVISNGYGSGAVVNIPDIPILRPDGNVLRADTLAPSRLTGIRYPLVNYYRTSGGLYGGLSKHALAATIYKSVGEFVSVNGTNPNGFKKDVEKTPGKYIVDGKEMYGGDCYLDIWSQSMNINSYIYNNMTDCTTLLTEDGGNGIMFPVESAYNHKLHRAGDSYAGVATKPSNLGSLYPNGFFIDSCKGEERIENYANNSISQVNETLGLAFAFPVDFKPNRTFPYRWIWSNTKNYGEAIDNYRIFPVANFFDTDGRYGEIKASINLFNKMYSFQEKGFAVMAINDRELIKTDSSTQISLGTGGVLDRIDYVSKEYGTQHPFSLFRSSGSCYFFDALKGKFISFGNGGLQIISDDLGLHDYTENASKVFVGGVGSVHGVFDYKNHEALWTLVKEGSGNNSGINPGIGTGFNPLAGIPYGSAAARVIVKSKVISGTPFTKTLTSLKINGIEQIGASVTEVNLNTATLNAEAIRDAINAFTPASGPNYSAQIGPPNFTVFPPPSDNDEANLQIFTPSSAFGDTLNGDVVSLTFDSNPPNYSYTTYDVEGGFYIPLDIVFSGTIGFNEKLKAFTGYYDFLPEIYGNFGDSIVSDRGFTEGQIRKVEELYTHEEGGEGEFYGKVYNSQISFVLNDVNYLSKTFDNMLVKIEQAGSANIISCKMLTDTELQTITFAGDTRAKFREGLFRFPMREKSKKARVRGPHCVVTFEIDNTNKTGISIEEVRTLYRISRKI